MHRFFYWLAGASAETLGECPNWERRKYVAFGATVLVPSLFAFIACAYALSTLTENWGVIVPVSLVWSFIILTVDRALLASYRPFLPFFRKFGQFGLRFVVALLMGITISHPLALLLFRDTIQSVVEKHRGEDIAKVREARAGEQAKLAANIKSHETEVATLRQRWDESFKAQFIAPGSNAPGAKPTEGPKDPATLALEKKVEEAKKPVLDQVAALEEEFTKTQAQATTLQVDLDRWQRDFERELNGQRSGIKGLGPRAKSIQNDQLAWRRAESARLADQLKHLTEEKNALLAQASDMEARFLAEFQADQAKEKVKAEAEATRLADLTKKIQAQQADQFVTQQNLLRETLKNQIDAKLAELSGLQNTVANVLRDERQAIEGILAEPRKDILTQTLALHELFKLGAQGGTFALVAYIVLTLLFMLVDTIPLIVKFFAKPGPYDLLLDRDETRFDLEHEVFLKGLQQYLSNLEERKLTSLTRNQPLENAVLDGLDRSRATKEFLEALIDMERTFDQRVREEKERAVAGGSLLSAEKVAMLEEMAAAFYANLRRRTEQFFSEEAASRMAKHSTPRG